MVMPGADGPGELWWGCLRDWSQTSPQSMCRTRVQALLTAILVVHSPLSTPCFKRTKTGTVPGSKKKALKPGLEGKGSADSFRQSLSPWKFSSAGSA